MKTISLNCANCGAPLVVEERATTVTCDHCGAKLGIKYDEGESPRDIAWESPGRGLPFTPGPIVGYGAQDTATGTIVPVPPLDFPGSVQVVPETLIEDQSALSIHELLRDVSGVTQSIGGSSNRTDDILMRGFRVRGNSDDFRKNGFRDSSRVQRDLANIDRIEFLKGPASVLYGAVGEPAGLVNFMFAGRSFY